jgi:hypothetical protein
MRDWGRLREPIVSEVAFWSSKISARVHDSSTAAARRAMRGYIFANVHAQMSNGLNGLGVVENRFSDRPLPVPLSDWVMVVDQERM